MSWLRCKQPALVALHCHCDIAALIANEACKVLPDEQLMYGIISRGPKEAATVRRISEFCGMQATQVVKSMPNTMAQL